MNGSALLGKNLIEFRLQCSQLRRVSVLQRPFVRRLIEINRRLFELIKHENNRAEQQDEKLHRHFYYCVEKQSETTLFKRAARKISLYLGLVRSEIRQRQKKSADQARPERISLVRIEREIDAFQFAHFA